MVVLSNRVLFYFTGALVCNAGNLFWVIRVAIFFVGSFFPIPLVCRGEVGIIHAFVATSNVRVDMSTFSSLGSMFFRNMAFPFYREVSGFNVFVILLLGARDGQTFVAIWIVVGANYQICGGEDEGAYRVRSLHRRYLGRVFSYLSNGLYIVGVRF